jgi:hypothetical protein
MSQDLENNDIPEVVKKADEIFRLVEKDQGFAFISDGLGAVKSLQDLYAIVKITLRHTEKTARLIRAWLKKEGQM